MTTWTHRCLIVPNAQVEFARSLSAAIAGLSGTGMWTAQLSAGGNEPATHWISSGMIDQRFADLLPVMRYPLDADPIYTPGQASLAAYLATKAGFAATEADVQALFDVSDASDQDPHAAMQRLGLQMVVEQMEQFA